MIAPVLSACKTARRVTSENQPDAVNLAILNNSYTRNSRLKPSTELSCNAELNVDHITKIRWLFATLLCFATSFL